MTATSSLVALFKTSKGTIKVNLFADKTPLTVASFVNLAQRGYYNGLNFHRVTASTPCSAWSMDLPTKRWSMPFVAATRLNRW